MNLKLIMSDGAVVAHMLLNTGHAIQSLGLPIVEVVEVVNVEVVVEEVNDVVVPSQKPDAGVQSFAFCGCGSILRPFVVHPADEPTTPIHY